MTHYLKAIVALIGGASAWGLTAASDNVITMAEWFGLAGALATALGVLAVPNGPAEDPVDPEAGNSEILFLIIGLLLGALLYAVFR
jgi:hypothetical protein